MLDDFYDYVNEDVKRGGALINKLGTACYKNYIKEQEIIKKQRESDDGR